MVLVLVDMQTMGLKLVMMLVRKSLMMPMFMLMLKSFGMRMLKRMLCAKL